MRKILAWLLALSLVGCATIPPPYVGEGPHPQVTRGHPVPPVDALGNVFALLSKLILWNWKMDNHDISAQTEGYLVRYIDAPVSNADGTHFSLNEYAPGRALSRLVHNHKVAWPYRLLIGLPVTLIGDVLIPGRLFAGLLNGDSYNPYTDIVSVYSDLPPVLLHEAGHAHDFNKRRYKGTYALIRIIPFVDLFQEYKASEVAFTYLKDTGDERQEIAAYKILYPAYGTYVGAYVPFPGGSVVGALFGHMIGRAKADYQQRLYTERDAAMSQAATAHTPVAPPQTTNSTPTTPPSAAEPAPSTAPAQPQAEPAAATP